MRHTFPMFILLLLLSLICAGLASAISVTPMPSSVNVGSNVVVNVNSLSSIINPCQIHVDFGDSSAGLINCAAGTVCVGNINHVYSASGTYTITATESGTCLGAAARLPEGANLVSASCPPLLLTTASLPGGVVGQNYSAQLTASGGVAPLSWQMTEGSPPLPEGLTLSPGGLISGTPRSYGISTFVVAVGDSCAPLSTYTSDDRIFSINITSPATSELTITRLQLSFDNGRAETTVRRNQPGLLVNADLRFNGNGLLQGYWEVDGRLLSQINQHLNYGKSIRLTSPAVPFLPTFVEGSHRVRLVITSPENEITFPEAIYYVTSEESTAGLAPIRASAPRNHAELAFKAQTFSWEDVGRASVYLIEFFEKEGEEPVAAAYTRAADYALPEAILAENFAPGKAYLWWVKSYDDEGNLAGVSALSRFIFQ